MFNQFAHRYSRVDTCNYALVDSYDGYSVQNFYGQVCSEGYDQCALERDQLNYEEGQFRYVCAEDTQI